MENNFENTPNSAPDMEGNGQGVPNENVPGQQTYTDPNADYQYSGGYNYYQGNGVNQNPGNYQNMDESPMTMGDWVLTILAWMIPCVGLVLYLVWAFGKNGNVNRRNFCRAYLIIYLILMVLSVILISVLSISIYSIMPGY